MKANDYRVGNIVDTYSPRRITGEDIHFMEKKIRHCPPIEMSKEWAERSEMKIITSGDNTYYSIPLVNGCFIYFNELGKFHGGVVIDVEDEHGEMIEDIDVISEIKYVHELQNIYFVFTGKELIFKDK